MSEVKINAALIQGYQAANLGLATSYENVKYDPTPGVPHVLVDNLPAGTQPSSLGIGGTDEHLGVLSISIKYPVNEGTGNLLAKVDAARAYFVAGRRLTYMSQCVVIRRSERSQILRDGAWSTVVVSVYYEAQSTRPEV